MFSTNGLGIMSLLALLAIVGVIILQVAELNFYGAPPSLWPM